MTKKVFVFVILYLLFLLPSCSQPAEKETFDGVACPVEKIQWGMSIQESLDALGVAEEDAELKTQQSGEMCIRDRANTASHIFAKPSAPNNRMAAFTAKANTMFS